MSDSNKHAGFSFQISDTPPPARARERTPLADLELDLGDFGEVARPKPVSARHPARSASPWVESPHAPVPADQGTANAQTHTPGTEQNRPHLLERDTEQSVPPAGASAPQVAPAPGGSPKPAIKKIAFPARRPNTAPEALPTEGRSQPSKTKFSKSIGATPPRRTLESEPESEKAPTGSPLHMAPPEDLPSGDQELLSARENTWSADTPSAREIWKKARSSWNEASRRAADWGGQGLRAGRALAVSMNEKVRDRIKDSSKGPAQEAGGDPAALPPVTESEPRPGPGPSVAGRVILGLARTTGRRLAAPLSAAGAAIVVYLAGSQVLGTDGAAALSKAVQGPEIPELGELEDGKSADPPEDEEREGKQKQAATNDTPRGPLPMQTELTDMPDGLSWPGKGLVEVVTSGEELIYVDGVFTGRGPLRRIPVSPGQHEISIRKDGDERNGKVDVQTNRNTRAVFKSQ